MEAYSQLTMNQIWVIFGWIAAIIAAAILVKRGLGTPSKLFLWGSVILLMGINFIILTNAYLINKSEEMTTQGYIFTLGFLYMVGQWIELAGIILIIVGFWKATTSKSTTSNA